MHVAAWHGQVQTIDMLVNLDSNSEHNLLPCLPSNSSDGRCNDAITVLKSLIMEYPDDDLLQRALGNEYLRQKTPVEAKRSFDASVRTYLRNAGTSEITQLEYNCIFCDDCRIPIRGRYYKCMQCGWDYDLCETCHSASGHSHPPEDMIIIPSEEFSSLE